MKIFVSILVAFVAIDVNVMALESTNNGVRGGKGVLEAKENEYEPENNRKLVSHGDMGARMDSPTHEPNISFQEDCDSPFGYGTGEFDRLVKCFGADSIVVAAYQSNVAFAAQVMSAVAILAGEKLFLGKIFLERGFQFYMQAKSGKCQQVVPSHLCYLLKCSAVHPAAVGSFVEQVVTDPSTLPTVELLKLCVDCGTYDGNSLDMKVGGSGSGSGMQLYCTDLKRNESTPLLTVGGGSGSGAGPGVSWGTGGGAGMQILLEKLDGNVSCTGGGCGAGGKSQGIVRDEGCETDEFVRGICLVKKAVGECINCPTTKLSVSAGGGSGGGANDNESLLYRFSTGFGFSAGPKPVTSSSGGGGNTTDSQLKSQCSYSYADAVCTNANYFQDHSTSFELCQCPVQQLYNPPLYSFNCSYSESDPGPSMPPVDAELLKENCKEWCPEEGSVTSYSGEACPVLLPACSCKASNR